MNWIYSGLSATSRSTLVARRAGMFVYYESGDSLKVLVEKAISKQMGEEVIL
jgi:hypothetical protein